MNREVFTAIFVFVFALGGCSTSVKRPDSAGSSKPIVKALQGFEVTLSDQAQEQWADNVKFDVKTFNSTLERSLNANKLIAEEGSFRLKVVIDDIRVRSTFNAIMWGFMAGEDHLHGDVIILDLEDKAVYQFRPEVSYAFGGVAGTDSTRMNYLYESFAEAVVEELLEQKDASNTTVNRLNDALLADHRPVLIE